MQVCRNRLLHQTWVVIDPPISGADCVGAGCGQQSATAAIDVAQTSDAEAPYASALAPGSSKPTVRSAASSSLRCSGVSSTSGGRTVSQSSRPVFHAMAAFIAEIIGYFANTARVAS